LRVIPLKTVVRIRELTVAQAAKRANVHPVTVRAWLKEKRFAGRKLQAGGRIGGRAWRIDRASFALWLKERSS
jgi:excisionase family DNA binding protein